VSQLAVRRKRVAEISPDSFLEPVRATRHLSFPPRESLRNISQLLPEPTQDARLRDPHCACAHPQLERDLVRDSISDRGEPECSPGALLELVLDQVQGATDHAAIGSSLARVVGIGRLDGRELREPELGVCPACSSRFPSELSEMVEHFVLRDRPEPAAKGIAFPVFAEARDMGGYRLKNLLEDIGDLLVRQVPAPARTG
jgi:hypothetical protein